MARPYLRRTHTHLAEGCTARLCCTAARRARASHAQRCLQRPITVKVEFQDVTGAKQRLALDELQARVFLHEFDHLQSVLFHDRMEPEVLATVQPQLDALEAAYAANKQAQ